MIRKRDMEKENKEKRKVRMLNFSFELHLYKGIYLNVLAYISVTLDVSQLDMISLNVLCSQNAYFILVTAETSQFSIGPYVLVTAALLLKQVDLTFQLFQPVRISSVVCLYTQYLPPCVEGAKE
jgi:hypothetical protein